MDPGQEGQGREVLDSNEHGGFLRVGRGTGDQDGGALAGIGWGFGWVETHETADEVAEAGVPQEFYGRAG